MMLQRRLVVLSAMLALCIATHAAAQSPSAIYTWAGTGNVQQWAKNFGTNTATFANTNAGELTFTETGTAGSTIAVSDNGNRIRESSTGASGGLDLTGLSSLQFDVSHNGSAPVNVQFFAQASTGFNFVALGPDVAVQPGLNTYTVPLTGMTAAQIVYIRTIGLNIRDHAAQGNLTWTLQEVRSVGPALTQRDLVTFDNGTAEGGLQGAIVNFDNAAIQGNDTFQNQTGLSHSSAGSGSLQWTDLGGSNGGAITVGNGTAWGGNTFNNRETDLSNYNYELVRISATEVTPGAGGSINVQPFFQKNNFAVFNSPGTQALPIDGQFHDLIFPLAGQTLMDLIDTTGVNLGAHDNNLVINIDLIRFTTTVPEPASITLCGFAVAACVGMVWRKRRTG
jgi:PEP-CTERM motif-containing protein